MTAAPATVDHTLLSAARWYARRRGYRAFALRPRNKTPATEHGVHDATSDALVIEKMWSADPEFNVGIATGAASGVVVIDVDGASGEASLAELVRVHGPPPLTAEVVTGRGRHLYFAAPSGEPIRNSAGRLGPGLDVRGDGGYVVAPPSIHPSGATYRWVDGRRPDQTAPATMPEWLVEMLVDRPALRAIVPATQPSAANAYARSALERECGAVACATPGGRNQRLNEAAFALGQLVAGGALAERDVHAALMAAAVGCGLEKREAERTIASGLAAKQPRTTPERSDRELREGCVTGALEMPESLDLSRRESNGRPASRPSKTEPWPQPMPLSSAGELPSFPIHVLPPWLKSWVTAESTSSQTPVDLAAMLALAVIATCVQRRVEIQARSDWREQLCLFVCVVLETGARKSPVFAKAFAPIYEYERSERERLADEIAKTADKVDVARKRLEAAKF